MEKENKDGGEEKEVEEEEDASVEQLRVWLKLGKLLSVFKQFAPNGHAQQLTATMLRAKSIVLRKAFKRRRKVVAEVMRKLSKH